MMKKIFLVVLITFGMYSCSKKEMKLSRSNFSIVEEIIEHSPIYIEKKEGADSIYVNKNNSISGTNTIFSVDRDINVKTILEEVNDFKGKKYKKKIHKDDKGVYFTYIDTLNKNIAFFPFTEIYFEFKAPESMENTLYFDDSNKVFFEGKQVEWKDLDSLIEPKEIIHLGFGENLPFEKYLQNRIKAQYVEVWKTKVDSVDRVYPKILVNP